MSARPTDVDPLVVPTDALTHRDSLVRVWEEIRALPLRQRVALLLTLQDDDGRGTIELWPQTGIASVAEIASVLEITEAQLGEIWPTLPRDDQWIAGEMGVTPPQVVNLRTCARERLAGRLRDVFAPGGGLTSPPGLNRAPNGLGIAIETLHRQFETMLARAAREEDPPSLQDVTAYVDGTLDNVDREIFESRLESNPVLRANVDELIARRDTVRETATAPASAPASPVMVPAAPAATVGRAIRTSRTSRERPTDAAASGAIAPVDASKPVRRVRRPRPADVTTVQEQHASATTEARADRARRAPAAGRGRSTDAASTPSAARAAGRAATRAGSFWMLTALAAATAAAVAILAVMWWKGVPSKVPPASTQARSGAPPAPDVGAGAASTLSSTPSSTLSSAPSSSAPSSTSSSPPPVPASQPILIRDAGRIITVDTGGRLSGLPNTLAGNMVDIVTQALRVGVLPGAEAFKGLGQRDLTVIGVSDPTEGETLTVLAPLATVVRDTQPTFRWTPQTGARAYVVTIYSASFDVVIVSPSVRETTWRTTTPLKPGAMYLWQVTAATREGRVHAPTPPSPDARFRVIDAAARRELELALANAGSSSRLLAGLFFAQSGLLDEAEEAFTALAKENPGSEPITRLLSRVRERRGEEEE